MKPAFALLMFSVTTPALASWPDDVVLAVNGAWAHCVLDVLRLVGGVLVS